MTRILLVAALVALPARADLQFKEKVVPFGEVKSGRPLRHPFTFTNNGKSIVTITRLSATCGCLTPKLDKTTYQAGESGSFLLEVNTLTQPSGPNLWRVHVEYTEGDSGKTQELHLTAIVVSEIKVEPPKLALSTVGTIGHDILVTDQRALPLRVRTAQATSPHLAVKVSGEGKTYRVRVEVKESLPAGTHEEMVSILTDDPDYRELRVPVTVTKRVKAGVSPTPSSVNLTIPRGQSAPSRVVLLRGEGEQPVEVERVEVDNPALRCSYSAGAGNMTTLRVSVDETKVTEVLRGTVKVHFRKPVTQAVVIPVHCTVR